MSDRKRKQMIEADSHAVRCASCDLPALEVRAGVLVVLNHHHGGKHVNTYSLAWIKQLIEESERQIINNADAR